jgi:hypothetical protein
MVAVTYVQTLYINSISKDDSLSNQMMQPFKITIYTMIVKSLGSTVYSKNWVQYNQGERCVYLNI